MATIAEFTLPAPSFPLGSVFDGHPSVTVELERVIPTSKTLVPYFWVRHAEEQTEQELESALGSHPDVQSLDTIDEVNGEYLMRVNWNPSSEGFLKGIAETEVTLLSGTGSAGEWSFELRADEREAISTFQQYCREQGVSMELTALYTLSEMETGTQYNLTEEQREALVLAYNQGYYQSPRQTTLDEMAEEVGITGQSLGSRLRRGIHRLVGATLIG